MLASIRCPNRIGRKNRLGVFVPDLECGRFMAQVESDFHGQLTLYCPACKSFFNFSKNGSIPQIKLIDKKTVDFENIIKYEIKGYQTEI